MVSSVPEEKAAVSGVRLHLRWPVVRYPVYEVVRQSFAGCFIGHIDKLARQSIAHLHHGHLTVDVMPIRTTPMNTRMAASVGLGARRPIEMADRCSGQAATPSWRRDYKGGSPWTRM